MHSLALKLVIAFVFVSLVGIAIIALLASRITAVEFGNFINEQNQALILQQLEEYYAVNGSWRGARPPNPGVIGGRGQGQGAGNMNMTMGMGVRNFTLTDAQGTIIIASQGQRPGDQLAPAIYTNGTPVVVNNETVGYLLDAGGVVLQQFRAAFARRVNQALLLGAWVAVIISLLLAALISRSFIRPLKEITQATEKIAAGDLSQTVPVRSEDEIGQLATSFNLMSSQLQRARDLRRQMTADIAHDLRTPLSIILGHSEALSDGVLPPTPDTLHILHDEAKRLDRMVADLRTLSLADAGELPMNVRPTNPADLLERAVMAHMPAAQHKQITLTADLPPQLPAVLADPHRMAQVLDNLVGNALRYTPVNGRIQLSARHTPQGLEFRIQDSGPGLTPEQAAHVFDRFYRADKARARAQEGGSGLGLAIARSIVLAHNGRITVTSTPGAGATFIILLPLA